MNTRTWDWQGRGGQPPERRPYWLAERTFRRCDVPEVRRFAQAFGSRAGLCGGQLPDFVLAVNEAAACATARWPGAARVRLWSAGARIYCEVRADALVQRDSSCDAAAVRGLPPGGRHGEEDALRRYVLRRVCDYFCVASGPDDTRVLLTMAVRRAARDPSGRAGTRRPR
jgi:hypothetical protein